MKIKISIIRMTQISTLSTNLCVFIVLRMYPGTQKCQEGAQTLN